MASLPGMTGDVFFGDADKPLPDWRNVSPEHEDDDDDHLSQSEREAVIGVLGFDPSEEESHVAESAPLIDKAITVHRDGKTFTQHRKVSADTGTTQDDTANASGTHAAPETLTALAHDFPDESSNPTLWGKVKGIADKVHVAVASAMLRASPAIMAVIPELIDTPDDFQKFGFAPSVSGTAGTSRDPIKNATGISTHLACSIASRILAAAYVKAKSALAGAPMGPQTESDQTAAAVEFVAQLLEAIAEAIGFTPAIDRDAIRAAIAAKQ